MWHLGLPWPTHPLLLWAHIPQRLAAADHSARLVQVGDLWSPGHPACAAVSPAGPVACPASPGPAGSGAVLRAVLGASPAGKCCNGERHGRWVGAKHPNRVWATPFGLLMPVTTLKQPCSASALGATGWQHSIQGASCPQRSHGCCTNKPRAKTKRVQNGRALSKDQRSGSNPSLSKASPRQGQGSW